MPTRKRDSAQREGTGSEDSTYVRMLPGLLARSKDRAYVLRLAIRSELIAAAIASAFGPTIT
jgi:hypothetical protein